MLPTTVVHSCHNQVQMPKYGHLHHYVFPCDGHQALSMIDDQDDYILFWETEPGNLTWWPLHGEA